MELRLGKFLFGGYWHPTTPTPAHPTTNPPNTSHPTTHTETHRYTHTTHAHMRERPPTPRLCAFLGAARGLRELFLMHRGESCQSGRGCLVSVLATRLFSMIVWSRAISEYHIQSVGLGSVDRVAVCKVSVVSEVTLSRLH